MKRSLPFLALLLTSPLAPNGCGGDPAPPPEPADPTVLRTATTDFAAALLRAAGGDGNQALSPWSVWLALAMAGEGAAGDTAAEIRRVLGVAADTAATVADVRSAMRPRKVAMWRIDGEDDREVEIPAYDLHVACALWGRPDLAFRPDFAARLERGYDAPVRRVDFADGDVARRTINRWVAENTGDHIRELVSPGAPPPDALAVLASAVHLRVAWHEPFLEEATVREPFTCADGAQREVPLMRRLDYFAYAEDDRMQVVRIPTAGLEVEMVIVVPRAVDGLAAVQADLRGADLRRWIDDAEAVRVDLTLPRFAVRVRSGLVPALRTMGVHRAFVPGEADFSRATEEPLVVTEVLHEALVEVDENGVVAAAATAMVFEAGAAAEQAKPKVVRADHPFLFALVHRRTGVPLFVGRVADPGHNG